MPLSFSQQQVAALVSTPLDNISLQQLCPFARIAKYEDLDTITDINSLFPSSGQLILLYPVVSHTNGHWVVLLRRKNEATGAYSYDYLDSYGADVDRALAYGKDRIANELVLRGLYRRLSDLLRGYPVFYNTCRLQDDSPDVQTCGYWVASRIQYANECLDDWVKRIRLFSAGLGLTMDDIVVADALARPELLLATEPTKWTRQKSNNKIAYS